MKLLTAMAMAAGWMVGIAAIVAIVLSIAFGMIYYFHLWGILILALLFIFGLLTAGLYFENE